VVFSILSPDGVLVFATVALAFGLLSWGQLIFKNIVDMPYLRWTFSLLSLWSCLDTICIV